MRCQFLLALAARLPIERVLQKHEFFPLSLTNERHETKCMSNTVLNRKSTTRRLYHRLLLWHRQDHHGAERLQSQLVICITQETAIPFNQSWQLHSHVTVVMPHFSVNILAGNLLSCALAAWTPASRAFRNAILSSPTSPVFRSCEVNDMWRRRSAFGAVPEFVSYFRISYIPIPCNLSSWTLRTFYYCHWDYINLEFRPIRGFFPFNVSIYNLVLLIRIPSKQGDTCQNYCTSWPWHQVHQILTLHTEIILPTCVPKSREM